MVLADDQALARRGFRLVLDYAPDIIVVGAAADGRAALAAIDRLHPDVVLMDIRMPTRDGLAATRRLTATATRTRVLVLTTYDSTSTSTRRSAPARADSCSRTRRRRNSRRPCGWSRRATHCSRRR